MTEPRSDDLLRSRQEAALLLRLDPQNLSPSDALRCDLIATLRLSIDSAQADALEGRAADLGRLIVATESLVKLLPSDPPKPEASHPDPRVVLWNIIKEGRDRAALGFEGYDGKCKQIEVLQAELASRADEIAALRAQLTAGGLVPVPPIKTRVDDKPTLASQGIDPTEVVPPSEYLGVPPMRGPDDPPVRPPVIIEGKAVPNPPAAYDYNTNRSWRDHILPDGTITSVPMSRGRWWGPV